MAGAQGTGQAALQLLSTSAQRGNNSQLPNFVVYMSDDHGMLFSEPYGAKHIHTPNLANLAADGMRFTHAFNASPSCGWGCSRPATMNCSMRPSANTAGE